MKNENGLYPHQQKMMDEMRQLAEGSTVHVILSQAETPMRNRSFDAVYGGSLREGDMIVLDHKLRGDVGKHVVYDEVHITRHEDVDAAEPVIEQPKKRSAPPSMMLASMLAMVAGGSPHLRLLDDPFAALERRVLSREEALEAFKTTDADKARMDAAEAKRARKAAKLKANSDRRK